MASDNEEARVSEAEAEEQDGFKKVLPKRGKGPKPVPKEKQLSPADQAADMQTKYKAAATIVHQVLRSLIKAAVADASVSQLCKDGDDEIVKLTGSIYNRAGKQITKGIAFPTCVSVNNVVSHFTPLPTDPLYSMTLADGDVVKIQLGAHIDGYAAVQTETIIIGATKANPATGRKADVVKAAWTAAQIALRQMKAEEKNNTITDSIAKVAAQWDCKPVEGMLSCQHVKGAIDGKKRIILNPSHEQRSSHDKAAFAIGEVYGIDVLVASSTDGKCKNTETRTSVYQRVGDVSYQVKLKIAKDVIKEVEGKSGNFPFTVRSLEEEKAQMGIQEGERRGVFRPYDVTQTPKDSYVAAYMFTVLITEKGPSLLTEPSSWYSADKLKTEKELEDDDLKQLLASEVISVKSAGEVKAKEKTGAKRIRHKPKTAE